MSNLKQSDAVRDVIEEMSTIQTAGCDESSLRMIIARWHDCLFTSIEPEQETVPGEAWVGMEQRAGQWQPKVVITDKSAAVKWERSDLSHRLSMCVPVHGAMTGDELPEKTPLCPTCGGCWPALTGAGPGPCECVSWNIGRSDFFRHVHGMMIGDSKHKYEWTKIGTPEVPCHDCGCEDLNHAADCSVGGFKAMRNSLEHCLEKAIVTSNMVDHVGWLVRAIRLIAADKEGE